MISATTSAPPPADIMSLIKIDNSSIALEISVSFKYTWQVSAVETLDCVDGMSCATGADMEAAEPLVNEGSEERLRVDCSRCEIEFVSEEPSSTTPLSVLARRDPDEHEAIMDPTICDGHVAGGTGSSSPSNDEREA